MNVTVSSGVAGKTPSKERGTVPGPQLLLTLASGALAGDYDHNGIADTADYNVWR